jgi:Na+/proline symporter
MSDKQLLKAMRYVTLAFTLLVTLYAVNSDFSIFEMVENAYQVTLVTAFIPLIFGIFWRKATNQGGLAAIVCGFTVWIASMAFAPEDAILPAQFAGLLASLVGMIVGSVMPQFISNATAHYDQLKSGALSNVTPQGTTTE